MPCPCAVPNNCGDSCEQNHFGVMSGVNFHIASLWWSDCRQKPWPIPAKILYPTMTKSVAYLKHHGHCPQTPPCQTGRQMLSLPTHCHEASEILMRCFVFSVGGRSLIRAPSGATAMPMKLRGLNITLPARGNKKQTTTDGATLKDSDAECQGLLSCGSPKTLGAAAGRGLEDSGFLFVPHTSRMQEPVHPYNRDF